MKQRKQAYGSLQYLAVATWYWAVQLTLKLPSAYAVDIHLEGEKIEPPDGVQRPNKWAKYRDGKHMPKPETIAKAERAAPGSARWIRSPIWAALAGKFQWRSEVEEKLRDNPRIREVLFQPRSVFDETVFDLVVSRIPACAALGALDLLEAVILLLELGVLARSPDVHAETLKLYDAASRKITEIPELALDFPRLFEQIEARHLPRVNAAWDSPLAPWFVRLPDKEDPRYPLALMQKVARGEA